KFIDCRANARQFLFFRDWLLITASRAVVWPPWHGRTDMVQKRCRDRGVSPTWRKNDVGTEAFPRHGATTMSGPTRFADMAQKRCRDRGVSPTWRKNDVGTEAFPRHGAKTMSGQRRFPDMAQKRCRDRGVSPTWRKNDVGSHAHSLKN